MIDSHNANRLSSLQVDLVNDNWHSGKKNDDINSVSLDDESRYSTQISLKECSDSRLSGYLFSIIENNLDNVDRLHGNSSYVGLECNAEFSICGYYNLVFTQNGEECNMSKKIEISDETDKLIRKMSKMGETYDDVIQHGFTHLDGCSEFWNEE